MILRVCASSNVSQLDAGFWQTARRIERLGKRDNTFIFFTSDNGRRRRLSARLVRTVAGQKGLPLRRRNPSSRSRPVARSCKPGSTSIKPSTRRRTDCLLRSRASRHLTTIAPHDGVSFLPAPGRPPDRASAAALLAFQSGQWADQVAVTRRRLETLRPRLDVRRQTSGSIVCRRNRQPEAGSIDGLRKHNPEHRSARNHRCQSRPPATAATDRGRCRTIYKDVQQGPGGLQNWPRYESHHIEWPEYWLKRRTE